MATGRLHFALQAGSLAAEALVVTGLEGREGLSEPYDVQVEFLRRDGGEVDLEALVGQEAELTVKRPAGEERVFHGEAHRVELTGVAAGRPRYRLTIRPRLARLGRVTRSRIFQDRSVPDIVAAVLDEHGVAHRSALSGSPAARPFTVQYRETDLAFVSRLLEDEGIWYRFEHGPGRHELVLADGRSGHASAGDALPLRPRTGQGDDVEHAFALTRSYRAEPGSVTLRDFDFERPDLDLTATRDEAGEPEVYDWPGGSLDPGEGAARARRRLEGLRHGLATLEAETTCARLVPGADLELAGHGKLLVVRLRHHGRQELAPGGAAEVGARYDNAVEAIEASLPYRPRRHTPIPRLAGLQTATVVTPPGEEVHTDRHGRVKVRFHWDREGPGDDRGSCWVRVAQAWAGAGMGASFLPRAGQEVVVRFLDGDLARPLITGAVYNGQNPPPLSLPADKTQATTRSDSSPGGGGANELRFEDLAGQELVHHHAQRDQAVAVEHHHARQVRRHEALRVEKDRATQVLGAQSLAVAGQEASEIGGSSTLTVAGDRTTGVATFHEEKVGGSQAVTVAGSQQVSVRAAKAVFVGAAAALNVGGAYAVSVAGVHNQAVGGLKASQVGGASVEFVGGRRDEQVGKDRESTTRGEVELNVDGMMTRTTGADDEEQVDGAAGLEVAGSITLLMKAGTFQADALKLMVGGQVALSMASSGAVTLAGSSISVDGSTIETRGATVAKVSGEGAAGGSAQVAALRRPDDPRATVLVTVLDADGRPVVNEPFKVELPDGTVKHGRTDASGKAAIPGGKPGTAKVTFTALDEKVVEEA